MGYISLCPSQRSLLRTERPVSSKQVPANPGVWVGVVSASMIFVPNISNLPKKPPVLCMVSDGILPFRGFRTRGFFISFLH